jgi:hydroxyacylglutathione hydrolase
VPDIQIQTIFDKQTNCYLIHAGSAFYLVDTGYGLSRGVLKQALHSAGVTAPNLKLVILTHADMDHSGSVNYLRRKYGMKVAMHALEIPAAATGRMLATRQNRVPGFIGYVMAALRPLCPRFKPDILLAEGDDLSQYGLEARVLHTPGHTRGSISVLTKDGDFLCGDFLVGGRYPGINHLADDMAAMKANLSRIRGMKIRKIYPGHGRPFTFEEFFTTNG